MKAKLLVLLFGLIISTGAFACPNEFGQGNKLRWIVGGQFKGFNANVAGRGGVRFINTTNNITKFLTATKTNLGNWRIGGWTPKTTIFKYRGTGTASFVGAVKDAQSILVPI